ncbi:Transcriptional regulator [Frankia sp. AiPs1]|uniref:TetR/AcrR family transcriptional regulator n=1 Tax=Frankia sp. AiPa1 TaxID=573492 RepID=UPI00202BA49E|nr:TetR/AcrR family transcriptional regulator C-terminal ligand-binding domain-containing protein [Frankia sp. AiPa1]MCL9759599.1 TetR/AcrR family transcriptional regulator C-terminal ligand-binding domain-containing protein [Frankia sp. AiPa1]
MTTTSDARPPHPRRPEDRAPSGVRVPRAPGRPRDPRYDGAIIEAALHELATVGFTGLSMEAVAASAGVGKATVYRRWPTKDALIGDALDTLADDVETVETGSLRDDLVAWLISLRRRNSHSLAGQIMPKLAAEHGAHPELFATYSHRVLEPPRRWAADLLRRGIASGELPADVDVDLVVDMLAGTVSYRQYLSGDREVSGSRIGRIVDMALDGIRAREAGAEDAREVGAQVGDPGEGRDPVAPVSGDAGRSADGQPREVAPRPSGLPGGVIVAEVSTIVAAPSDPGPSDPDPSDPVPSGAGQSGSPRSGGQGVLPRLGAYPVGGVYPVGGPYPVGGAYPVDSPTITPEPSP